MLWNSSIPDTLGPERTVLVIEMSSLQGLKLFNIKAYRKGTNYRGAYILQIKNWLQFTNQLLPSTIRTYVRLLVNRLCI